MAQDVNAPQRAQPTDDEEWFDLRSLASEEVPAGTPVEVCSARSPRAYYAPSPTGTEPAAGPPPLRPSLAHGPGARFEKPYGPLVYFAFLVLIPVVSVVLFVLAPSAPPYEEPTADERAATHTVAPTPLPAAPLTAAPPVAALQVDSDPEGAYVYLDGTLAGITPFQNDSMASGWHTVSVEKSGYAVRDSLLYVDPEAATALAFALEPKEVESASGAPEPEPPPSADEPADDSAERAVAVVAGELRIETTPARAVVRIDGEPVGRTPLLVGDLTPGMYDIALAMPGYASHTRRVDVGPARRVTVRAGLVALTGTLSVLVHPWGSIYVDGELLARDTDLRRRLDVEAGPHVVRVEHPVLGVQERTVEVQPGQTTSVDFDLL